MRHETRVTVENAEDRKKEKERTNERVAHWMEEYESPCSPPQGCYCG